jgi:hypothetical protein
MIEILLAVSAAHSEYNARRRTDPLRDYSRTERARSALGLLLLLVLLIIISLLGNASRPAPHDQIPRNELSVELSAPPPSNRAARL